MTVVAPERAGNRCLAMNNWHRRVFPESFGAFDIDSWDMPHLWGMCKQCNAPTYVWEDTTDVRKGTAWIRDVGRRLNVPTYLITYRLAAACDRHEHRVCFPESATVTLLLPMGSRGIGGLDELATHIKLVRRAHAKVFHGTAE